MRTVAEALTGSVVVESSMTLQEASARMLDAEADAAIVMDADTLAGLLTAEDVARALAEDLDATQTPTGMVADRDPPVVNADEPLIDVHQRLLAEQRELAVAVGADGEPLGLVSLS
jgi:CBS domain-containing protein